MMINTNKSKSGLNGKHKVLLQDKLIQHGHVQAGHVEEDEKEFLFDMTIRHYEIQKKFLRIKLHEAENYFPQREAEDRSFKGPWFRFLNFKDEAGVVRNFRYTYWQDGQYVFNGDEWACYLDGEKVKVGDVLLFWRHRREKDDFFYHHQEAESGGTRW